MKKSKIRQRLTRTLLLALKKEHVLALLILVSFGATTLKASDPLLVDAVGTSTNSGVDAGNGYVLYMPQAALSGNLLVCGITYAFSSGRSLSVTDDHSNSWQVAVSKNGVSNTTTIVYAAGVAAGTQKITFTFDAALTSFQAACKEAYGVATSSPVDVTSSASGVGAPTISAGSMTTTTAGDLIFQYGNSSVPGNDLNSLTQFVTTLTAGSGWSPIIADVQTGQFLQDIQQANAGAITPSYTVTGASIYTSAAVAFKTSNGAGTAPPTSGIHIDHEYTIVLSGGTNASAELPSDGNFITVTDTDTSNTVTVSDSASNSYTKNVATGGGPEAITWYATNATTSPTLRVNVTNSGDGNTEYVMRDIRGVATSSPLDTVAAVDMLQSSFAAGTVMPSPPLVITPAAAGELVIVAMQNGCGPTQFVNSPIGATTDSVWFNGQTDADPFDEGEGHGHFITASSSQVQVSWAMQNSRCSGNGNAVGAAAWAFKPGAGSVSGPPAPPTNLQVAVH